MSRNMYTLEAKATVGGKFVRYGMNKRTRKFVRWSSPRGKALRARKRLKGKVEIGDRDRFNGWAKKNGLATRSNRAAVTTVPLRLKALREARALLGTVERGSNNRGPEVDRIILDNGGSLGEPWCGDFVAYVYRRAGSSAVQRAWASTLALGRLAGMTSHAARSGAPGDLVVFNFPGGASSDHVGLLVAYTDAKGKRVSATSASHIKTLDGNTGIDAAVSDSKTGGDGVGYKVRPIAFVDRTVRVHR